MATLPARSSDELAALMARAGAEGRVRTARKTQAVDARPAVPGEVVVTTVNGETETQSRPAEEGDWVVRNRSAETGHEQYLVAARTFAERYRRCGGVDPEGWQEFQPQGRTVRFLFLTPEDGSFTFTAPWGEAMVARPGDALVQDPDDDREIYRVDKFSFACTYEVIG